MRPLDATKITTVALLLVLLSIGAATAAAPEKSSHSLEFSGSWILVRLRVPLGDARPGGSFSLDTPFAELNAAIKEEGVVRIDAALPVSLEARRNPDALKKHGLDRTYRFHVAPGSDIPGLVERLSRIRVVDYAEPDFYLLPGWLLPTDPVIPNDPLFPQQWGLDQDSDADVDAPEAWEISTGGGVIIGVIDSGVDVDHDEFLGKLERGHNFVNNSDDIQDHDGHGSGVSSIAAANTDNSKGMAGVCWDCRIMPLVAAYDSQAADALVWATDHGARIVNVSQGEFPPSDTYLGALAYAYDAGVVQVDCVGNEDATPIWYPARYVETIAVGATKSDDWRADPFTAVPGSGSNYGPRLDVVAPGDLIVGADHEGGYVTNLRGTSFSSPLVAGLAGLVESVYPSAGREEVRHLIRSGAEDQVSADPDDTPGFDEYYGWGRVNMDRTLQATEASMSLRVAGAQSTRVYFDTASPLADSYDFIRGSLASLTESWQGVDLGEVVCLENDSPDADTTGNEDDEIPQPGDAFFYLARPNTAAGAGSYGGSTQNRDRRVPPPVSWARHGEQDGAEFGSAVAGAGDVNGDGYDDVVVGARYYTDDQAFEGGAFLHLGSADGLQHEPVWIGWGNQTYSRFGTSVGSAGDVDGDGYADIIVGAPYHSNGQTQEGRAYLFLGSATGPGSEPDWTAEGDQAEARFGQQVASAGDINGDGYDDVLVTAPQFDAGQDNEGRAFLYFGSSEGLGDVPWKFETNQAGARLGFGGGGAGDVNGDGYDDLVIGAHRYSNPEIDEGRLYVFLGSPSGPLSPPTTLEIDVPGARLGRAAATAGDVDGDGYDDIIAGALLYSGTESEEGAVFVYSGSPGGISTSPTWSFASGQADAGLGKAAATAGDINGDGYADVIVGAYSFDFGRTDEGGAWVFLGSASGLTGVPHWMGFGGQASAWFGWAVAGAGNVHGDESPSGHPYDDVVVGAYGYDENNHDEGRVHVYLGSATGLPTTTDCDE